MLYMESVRSEVGTLFTKMGEYVDLRQKEHYLFMHVDEIWGDNSWPKYWTFDALAKDISREIAQILFVDPLDIDNVRIILDLLRLYQVLEPMTSKEIVTDELCDEMNELENNPNWMPQYLSLEDLVKILERIDQEDGGLLNSFAPGKFTSGRQTVLIKDNDRIWDQLVLAGMPVGCDR